MQHKATSIRRDIQGIRGWAITLVLLFHFFPQYFPNGYIGVDMFFVISGYLIAMILKRFDSLGFSTFRTFYYRRAKRILPLYLLAVLVILLALIFVFPKRFTITNIKSAWKALTLTSNIKREDAAQDYEQLLSNAVDLFTHTWSLCVEMQFYIIVPVLFLLQVHLFSNARLFFSAVAAVSLIASLIVKQETAFNNVFCRIWQFMCGTLSFLLTNEEDSLSLPGTIEEGVHYDKTPLIENGDTLSDTESQVGDCVPGTDESIALLHTVIDCVNYGIIFMLACSFTYWPMEAHNYRVQATFLTGVLITLGHFKENSILANAFMYYVGNISYALYLFHWPVYVYVNLDENKHVYSYLIGIGTSIMIAVFTYHCFETKYLTLSKPSIFALVGVLFIGCVLVVRGHGTITDFAETQRAKVDTSIEEAIRINYEEGIHESSRNYRYSFCNYTSVIPGDSKQPPFGLCVMPKQKGNHTVLVIGNSYAGNHAGTVYDTFKDIASDFNVYFQYGCEALAKSCGNDWHRKIVDYFKPDVLFIIDRLITAKEDMNDTIPIEEDETLKFMKGELAYFEERAKKVYILNALPALVFYSAEVANTWLKTNHTLKEYGDRLTNFDEKFARLRVQELGKTCKKCEVYDEMPVFLNATGHFYPYNPDNNIMYFDREMHLSPRGLKKVRPVYEELAKNFKL